MRAELDVETFLAALEQCSHEPPGTLGRKLADQIWAELQRLVADVTDWAETEGSVRPQDRGTASAQP